MITPETLVKHELIGLDLEVVNSTNKKVIGVKGVVVGESRNTVKVRLKGGKEKSFIKDQCIFVFILPSGEKVKVDGEVLVGRPEDRIKKKFKKW